MSSFLLLLFCCCFSVVVSTLKRASGTLQLFCFSQHSWTLPRSIWHFHFVHSRRLSWEDDHYMSLMLCIEVDIELQFLMLYCREYWWWGYFLSSVLFCTSNGYRLRNTSFFIFFMEVLATYSMHVTFNKINLRTL